MPDNTFKEILLCLDNSEDSRTATKLALRLANIDETTVTGLHVYAAELHTERFRQLESYLPERYQNEETLQEQRSAHTTLITRGLEIISDSYMAPLTTLGLELGIKTGAVKREGKNYREILNEAETGYGLAVLGARGLGTLNIPEEDGCGSVAERVARGIMTDLLIVRTTGRDDEDEEQEISVAIDGSPESYGALLTAIGLARKLDKKLRAVAAFDPLYHQAAFQGLEGVLSEADGELFKLEEQEKLHTEIIDNNLAAMYRDHLDTAVAIAKDAGIEMDSELLPGKPYTELIKYARGKRPFMIVMGKTGVHADQGLEIGSATEKTLRNAPCSVYISTTSYTPSPERPDKDLPDISWTPEAEETALRAPAFARAMVRKMAEETAAEEGRDTVTQELLLELRRKIGL